MKAEPGFRSKPEVQRTNLRKPTSYFPEWDQCSAGEIARRPDATFDLRPKDLAAPTDLCDNYRMAKTRPAKDQLTAKLRQAIRDSGLSFYMLAKRTGVERMSLVLFSRGKRSLRLDKAGRLAAYFRLELDKKR